MNYLFLGTIKAIRQVTNPKTQIETVAKKFSNHQEDRTPKVIIINPQKMIVSRLIMSSLNSMS